MKRQTHRDPTSRETLDWAYNGGVQRMIAKRPNLIRPPVSQLSDTDINTIIVVKSMKRHAERKG